MTDQTLYVVNWNEGTDTLHRNPREECNVDDAVDRQNIDAATYEAMKVSKGVRVCRHCHPQEDPIA